MQKRHDKIVQDIINKAQKSAQRAIEQTRILHGHQYIVYFGLAEPTGKWHCIMRNIRNNVTSDTESGDRDEMLAMALERAELWCAPLHVVVNNIARVY